LIGIVKTPRNCRVGNECPPYLFLAVISEQPLLVQCDPII
jgi:hypothetical protein